MKRIVILASEFPPEPGGIGNHALHLAQGLEVNGYEVQVISDYRSGTGKEERNFDSQLPFEVFRIKRKKIILFSYLSRIRKAFSLAGKNDIILSTGKFPLWMGAFLSLFYKRKYIAVIHGSEIKLPNKLLRKLTEVALQKFDKVIAVSHYTKSLVSHLDLKRVYVVPNGFEVKVKNFNKEMLKPVPVMITVGNVTERKGQHNVIRALPTILKKYPDAKYQIVGIPTQQEELEKLALELGVESSVVFFGKVTDELKLKLLQEADVFVMLSESTKQGDVEGFGIAILEANSLGIPAIGAKGCGIEDAIKAGLSGKLINNKDGEQLLSALREILDNYDSYSKQAKVWSKNFTWDRIIKEYLDILQNQE